MESVPRPSNVKIGESVNESGDSAEISVSWDPYENGQVFPFLVINNERKEPARKTKTHAFFHNIGFSRTYRININAIRDGKKSPTILLDHTTSPHKPKIISAESQGPHAIKTKWTNLPPTDYTLVRLLTMAGKVVSEEKKTENEDFMVFRNLKPNTYYRVWLKAFKNNKNSQEIEVTVATDDIQNKPRPPVDLDFRDIDSSSMTVNWKNNPKTGNNPFKWKIQVKVQGKENYAYDTIINGDVTNHKIVRLYPFTVYVVEISSYNENGQSSEAGFKNNLSYFSTCRKNT